MKLFQKGKPGAAAAAPGAPAFQAVDRWQLLGLLDQIVNGGQTAILSLHDQQGDFVYAFQGGGLVHASGGRVRGARQAFDLLWEFQQGQCLVTPGADSALRSNLYIERARLLDLVRRGQAAFQAPVPMYPAPGQPPAMPPGYPPAAPPMVSGWPAPVPPGPPGWGPAPQAPGYPANYPAPPVPGPPAPPVMGPPPGWPPAPGPQAPVMPPQYYAPGQPPAAPPPAMPVPQAAPPQPPAPPQARPGPRFSVPPMLIPRRRDAQPAQSAPAPAPVQAPPPGQPARPQDDLKVLRATLAAQAPAVAPAAAAGGNWKLRGPEAPAARPARAPKPVQPKRPSPLRMLLEERTIKFLLWACERKYSPDDRWTLKDAFEVATMELRDQFLGAFAQSLGPNKGSRRADEDDPDQMKVGRMHARRKRR